MSMRLVLLLSLLMPCATAMAADGVEQAVRAADARYWRAFNDCDFEAMDALLSADVEFYHDKTGLTVGRQAVLDSLRKGPCENPQMKLRREASDADVRFNPLAGGFALLSGTQRFYATDAGKPERLDGQAEFTIVWQLADGAWRMHRIVSYAHGPVPYTPPAKHLALPPATLAAYAGEYTGAHIPKIVVAVDGEGLKLTAGDLVVTLRAETPTRFFAIERDLRFEFAPAPGHTGTRTLTVYENGSVVETATGKPGN